MNAYNVSAYATQTLFADKCMRQNVYVSCRQRKYLEREAR